MTNTGTLASGTATNLTAASLDNSGLVQAGTSLTSITSGATLNQATGTISTVNGDLNATASTLTNHGMISADGNMNVTTNGTDAVTLTNTGTLVSTGAMNLTVNNGVSNSATGIVQSGGNMTVVSGNDSTFTLDNSGRIDSAGSLTIGTTDARATVTNNADALIRAGGNLAVNATTVTNAGAIEGKSAIAIDATGALLNTASGKILTTESAAAHISAVAASITNAGAIQSSGNISANTPGIVTNSGTWLTTGTGSITADAASIANNDSGVIQSGGALTLVAGTTIENAVNARLQAAADIALTTPTSLTNHGNILGGGNMLVQGGSTGFDILNHGHMSAAQNFTFGSADARANVTNHVYVAPPPVGEDEAPLPAKGVMQAGGKLDGYASAIVNHGYLQSAGALTLDVSGALTNSAGAQLMTSVPDSPAAMQITADSVMNAGKIQSSGEMAISTAGAITNSDLINALGSTTLTVGTSLTNTAAGTVSSADNLAVKGSNAFAFDNSGRIQTGGDFNLGDETYRAAFDNALGGVVQAAGDANAFASEFSNAGTFQASGSLSLTGDSGITVYNTATGKILTGDALTIDTRAGDFTLDNLGLIQAGGHLTLGGTDGLAKISQGSTDAKLLADTFTITASTIDNHGMIMGQAGGTISGSSFTNHGSGSRFIGAADAGTTEVTLTGVLTNSGAIHSNGDLTLNAATIDNQSTGGISSQEALTLNAGSNIINRSEGALYSGGTMTLTAGGNITNHEDATIDTDGNFVATATNSGSTFLNQGQINVGGNATITARKFENVMAGAENLVREWRGLASNGSTIDEDNYTTANDSVPNVSTTKWYYGGHGGYSGDWFDDRESTVWGHFYRKEVFAGIDDPVATFGNKIKPQIAAANLTIDGFDSGRNVGGLLVATGTLAINGRNGSSTFLNDSMALEIQKWDYQATWWYEYTVGSYDWWNPTGDNHITNRLTTLDYAENYFSIGAGIRAATVTVTNVGTLTNMGSPFGASTTERNADGVDMSDLGAAVNVSAVTGTAIADPLGTTARGALNMEEVDGPGARQLGERKVARAAMLGQVDTLNGTADPGAGESGKAGEFGYADRNGGASANSAGAAGAFDAKAAAAFLNALKNARVSLGGLELKLPSNPNGYFVPNADPQAKYLVSVNDTFGIDTNAAIGSEKLMEELGIDPDYTQKRLGDAAYETYLVRQQLVDQLGSKFLAGQKNEAAQMEMLMANAAQEAGKLGLQFGVAPSPAQLANLTEDIVWMVEQVVGGQRVLVPQVYLSAKTRGLFDAEGANIAGDNVSLDVGTLANTGGTISGSENLAIKASGDIKNTSGTIGGGNVSLDAGGSIINETLTRGNDDSAIAGKTASIAATGNLDLSADKDIKILGGDVKAAGDASLDAGGEIVVDTIQTKTTTRTTTGSSGFIGSSTTTTTTTDVKNQASNLDFGGNVKIKSGGDTTLAGSNLNVGGNLDADVGGNLNVLARQDQHTVNTESKTSGFGVGGEGSIYGSQTKTTNDFTGTNVGSSIKVGGDANLTAAKTLTLEGSDLDVKGGGSINATDVLILDGKDERHTTTTTKTTSFGVYSDSSGSAGAKAEASGLGYSAKAGTDSESGTESGPRRLSGSASASAQAEGSAGTTIGVRTNTTTTDDYESKSRGSTISFGGDATIKAKNDLVVRGSDIAVGGDATIEATNQYFLAGQDVKTSSSNSTTMTAGLNFNAQGSASAEAEANLGPTTAGASAKAEAGGEVSAGFKFDHNTTTTNEGSTTARVSTIKVGGNLTRNAENNLVDVGTDIEVGGNLDQSAKNITSLAAENTSWSSSDSQSHTAFIGVYADAKASASAEGGASSSLGGGPNVAGSAEASAEVTAGLKMQYGYESSSSSERSTEAVVSNIKVGGNINSKSTEKTTLVGTNIESGGDVTLEAKSLDYRAAQNTSSSSSNEANAEATLKMGVGAGASASTDGDASAGYGLQGSIAASGGKSNSSESSTEAVTGSLVAGGKLTIKTQDDARFEGTNLEAGGDASIQAGGNVTFDAARNTSESSSDGFNVSGELGGNTYGGSKAVKAGLEGGYSSESSSSSEAVTGSLKSGGNLSISSGGNATFEGTDLSAGGEASVEAKGDVTFKQATSTSSSTSSEVSGNIGFGAEKGGDGGSSKEFEAGIEGGYSTENEQTAKTSTISTGNGLTIKSGRDTTLQGTNIESGGDVNVAAGGNLNLTAKEESSTSFGISGGLSVGGGSETKGGEATKKKEMSAELGLEGQAAISREGGTIQSGGNVNLSSGKNTTLVGTQVESAGDINVAAGGTVTQKKAQSASVGGSIGLSMSHETETKSPAGGTSSGASNSSSTPSADADAKGKKDEPAKKPSAGLTDIGFNADASSQGTSLKAGSGKVNIQQNAKSSPAPKK